MKSINAYEAEQIKIMDEIGHTIESDGVLYYLQILNQAIGVLDDCGRNAIPSKFVGKYLEATNILKKLRTETINHLREENYHKDKVSL